jgi:N-glycosidase YbiA
MNTIIVRNVEWLRNDYRCDIEVAQIIYPTVEHAYQATKITDYQLKQHIAQTDSVRQIRRIVKNVPDHQKNNNFDKATVMEALLRKKFVSDLGVSLANTGSSPIEMEGYDEFWGTGESGTGENIMGKILQKIRAELQILYGINPTSSLDDEDDDEDEWYEEEDTPTLQEAILNNPDEDLAAACQDLFDTSEKIVSLLDDHDSDVQYIADKTGASQDTIKSAIEVVTKFKTALTNLETLLCKEEEEEEEEDDDDCDESDDSSLMD